MSVVGSQVWSVKEKLFLSSCVLALNDNWPLISKQMEEIFLSTSHGDDFFSQKNCAQQYASMVENLKAHNLRKRSHSDLASVLSPTKSNLQEMASQLFTKLKAERLEELRTVMNKEKALFRKVKKEIETIRSGELDDKLEALLEEEEKLSTDKRRTVDIEKSPEIKRDTRSPEFRVEYPPSHGPTTPLHIVSPSRVTSPSLSPARLVYSQISPTKSVIRSPQAATATNFPISPSTPVVKKLQQISSSPPQAMPPKSEIVTPRKICQEFLTSSSEHLAETPKIFDQIGAVGAESTVVSTTIRRRSERRSSSSMTPKSPSIAVSGVPTTMTMTTQQDTVKSITSSPIRRRTSTSIVPRSIELPSESSRCISSSSLSASKTTHRRRRTKSWHQLPWTATLDTTTFRYFDACRRRWRSAEAAVNMTPLINRRTLLKIKATPVQRKPTSALSVENTTSAAVEVPRRSRRSSTTSRRRRVSSSTTMTTASTVPNIIETSRLSSRRKSRPSFGSNSSNLSGSFPAHFPDAEAYKAWKRTILAVFNIAACHKHANLFYRPVTDDLAPYYSKYVKKPMCLNEIKKAVENQQISTTNEFKRDLMLIFANAVMYNPRDHEVHEMAVQMAKEITPKIHELLDTTEATALINAADNQTDKKGKQEKISVSNDDHRRGSIASTVSDVVDRILGRDLAQQNHGQGPSLSSSSSLSSAVTGPVTTSRPHTRRSETDKSRPLKRELSESSSAESLVTPPVKRKLVVYD